MKKRTLSCSQCGGTDIEIIDESLAKCKHCGTHVKIENKKDIKSTIVIKSVEGDVKGKTPEVAFLKVKKNCEISDFTRQAYVDLFTSKVTENICSAKFLPAVTETRNYVLVTGKYDLNYSANLGFDRTEKYLSTEKVKRSDGSYSEDIVEKERVVTDWKPTTGKFSGSCNAVYVEGGLIHAMPYQTQERFDKYILPNMQENVEIINENDTVVPFAPDSKILKKTYDWGAEIVASSCKKNLGGNHCKDFSYSYTEKPDAIVSIVSEEFVLPYTVSDEKGKEYNYKVVSFSNKVKPYVGSVLEDDFYDTTYNKNAKNRKKSLFLPTISVALLFDIIVFISALVTNLENATFGEVFIPALLISTFASAVVWFFLQCIWGTIHAKAVLGIIKDETSTLNYEKDKKKCETLQSKLKELGFEPLTNEEKLRFIYLNAQENSKNAIQKFIIWLDNLTFKK